MQLQLLKELLGCDFGQLRMFPQIDLVLSYLHAFVHLIPFLPQQILPINLGPNLNIFSLS